MNQPVARTRIALPSWVFVEHGVSDIAVGDPVAGGTFGSMVGEDDAARYLYRAGAYGPASRSDRVLLIGGLKTAATKHASAPRSNECISPAPASLTLLAVKGSVQIRPSPTRKHNPALCAFAASSRLSGQQGRGKLMPADRPDDAGEVPVDYLTDR